MKTAAYTDFLERAVLGLLADREDDFTGTNRDNSPATFSPANVRSLIAEEQAKRNEPIAQTTVDPSMASPHGKVAQIKKVGGLLLSEIEGCGCQYEGPFRDALAAL
jgi:hypothetical protein